MIQIPRLETERLVLDVPHLDDLPAMIEWFKSPRSAFIGGPVEDSSEIWGALLRTLGHWQVRGYGFWHLKEKETGAMCGYTGFLHKLDWPEAELCWGVYDGYEGKGFAFEAATCTRAYGAKHLGISAPISIIDTDNARSIALAKRMGATLEKTELFQDYMCHFYRHPTVTSEAGA